MTRMHVLALAALAAGLAGCTSLREIPRGQYADLAERRNVRLVTQDSLTYEFDYVNVRNDSLIGYRRQDVEGPIDQYATVQMPLIEVAKLSVRGLDWYRTGLIGGGVVLAIVARGLTKNDEPIQPGDTGGGPGGGRVP